MNIDYAIVRSKRKTVALEITKDARVLVRAPMRMPKGDIARFVASHQAWAVAHMEIMRQRLAQQGPEPTPQQEEALRKRAKAYIPGRVAAYAAIMGVAPAGITITKAKTRFGSCSGKNRLSFSLHLMRYPAEAVDYVVVHELAHIVHKNHSKAFYDYVAQFMPDYQHRRALLKGPASHENID